MPCLLDTKKFLFWSLRRWKIRSFTKPKSWWKDDIYWILKFLFWTFQRWEIDLSVNQKFDEKMIFTDHWKVLALKFLEMRNTVFFEPESWWKFDIYWLLKSSCFEVFDDGKYSVFFSNKVDRKMVFTWSSWTFHNISGLGKYGFSCSGIFKGIVMQIEKTLLNDRLRVSNESWNFAS